MKATPFACLLLLANILLFSCRSKNNFPYAIRDFRGSLQPYLTKAVNRGFVSYEDNLGKVATNEELKKLTQSEHPILRAIAFRDLLGQLNNDHFDLIMNNLGDTAVVAVERGEFGLYYKKITDYIIEMGKWKTIADRNKTAEEIVLRHNQLKSAYSAINIIGPQEKYYNLVKEMAQRDVNFDQQYAALYALAKFKKKEDIELIKYTLIAKRGYFDEGSFSIVDSFPNEAYVEVYQAFFRHKLYQSLLKYPDSRIAEAFVASVATLKNKVSANILDSILHIKPYWKGMIPNNIAEFPDSDWKHKIYSAIRNNECEAYVKLKKETDAYLIEYDKKYPTIPLPESSYVDLDIPKKDTLETVKWWDK